MASAGAEAQSGLGGGGAGRERPAPPRAPPLENSTSRSVLSLSPSIPIPPKPADLATLRTVPTTSAQVRAFAEAAGRLSGLPPALGVAKPTAGPAPPSTAPGNPSRARDPLPLLATTFDACPDQEPLADFFAAQAGGITFPQGLAVNLTDSWGLPSVAPSQFIVAAARTIPDNPKRRGLIMSVPGGFSAVSFAYSTYATIAKFKPAEYGVLRPTLSLWAGEDPGGEGELLATATLPLTNETLTADRTPILWNFHPAGMVLPGGGNQGGGGGSGRKAKSLLLTGTVISPTMGEDVFYLPTYIDDLKVWA